jgi:predicted transcriptional regulator
MELQDLSRCEQRVMAEIWGMGEADMRMIMQIMEQKGTIWKPQTVSTFLARLVRKGYLNTRREGRTVFYIPKIECKTYAEKLQEEYEQFCKAAGYGGVQSNDQPPR